MIVGIDNLSPGGSPGPGTAGGMRDYLADLLEFLPKLRPAFTFKLFSPVDAGRLSSVHGNLQLVPCRAPSHRLGRVAYEQAVLPRLIRKQKIDVWLGICNTLPLACPCRAVLIVQSLQYVAFPRAYPFLQRAYLRLVGPASARRAHKVIALSNAARDLIIERFHVPAHKIVIAHNGLSRSMFRQMAESNEGAGSRVLEARVGKRRYILSVSSFYEYKNMARLIQAFARAYCPVGWLLVLVGAQTERVSKKSLMSVARQSGIADRVVFVGHVPHDQMAVFYRHAEALVMPSLEETFGLPILEAMALGCPVLTSSLGSMAEVAGDAACLVDPYRTDSIAAGIGRVMNDEAYRNGLALRGRVRAAQFTNNRSAEQIAAALEQAGS